MALSADQSSVCRFVNVEHGGKAATLLLENPAGSSVAPYVTEVHTYIHFQAIQTLKA
jgi:hypothetical protein